MWERKGDSSHEREMVVGEQMEKGFDGPAAGGGDSGGAPATGEERKRNDRPRRMFNRAARHSGRRGVPATESPRQRGRVA